MKIKNLVVGMVTVLTASLLFVSTAVAALEDITVMALGPLDGRAVVKLPDQKMQVLKVGDTITQTQAKVIQVLVDKLVLEEIIEQESKAPVKQTVWLYKTRGGKSRIQRLDKQGPPPQTIITTETIKIDGK